MSGNSAPPKKSASASAPETPDTGAAADRRTAPRHDHPPHDHAHHDHEPHGHEHDHNTAARDTAARGIFDRDAYWRSIEELVDPDLRARLAAEFPVGADTPPDAVSRRHFLSLLGASAALGGAGGCMQRPRERIVPYTHVPQAVTPGVPLHYASTLTSRMGLGVGVVVTAREGRPVKIDGNPAHPASLGASGPQEQAQLLQLYDPDRSQSLTHRGLPRAWRQFYDAIAPFSGPQPLGDGTGVHVLIEPCTSVVVDDLLARIHERLPRVQVHVWGPTYLRKLGDGLQTATGQRLLPRADLTRARVILSLDADFLGPQHPYYLHLSRQFAEGRRVDEPGARMNRLYVVEPAMTVTGMAADHRFPKRGGDVGVVAVQLLAELAALPNSPVPEEARAAVAGYRAPEADRPWIGAIARDLAANRGRSFVLAGLRQPPEVHALTHFLNAALGNLGAALEYGAAPFVRPDTGALDAFVSALRAGEVQTAIVCGGNPVFTAPPSMDLARLLAEVPESAYFGLYRNETAAVCNWFLPAAHPLESWGDARAFDGTVSLMQPIVAPLYDGRTLPELLAVLAGERGTSGHELLARVLGERYGLASTALDDAIGRGIVDGTRTDPVPVETNWGVLGTVVGRVRPVAPDAFELALDTDYKVGDGEFGNIPWLQEMPDPVTKLTWDNALHLSPATAKRLNLKSEDVVTLDAGDHATTVPVLVVPGHADDAATLHFGYGRIARSESVAHGVGTNAFDFVPQDGVFLVPATIARTGATHPLALTQLHWSMEGRPIVLSADSESFRQNPDQFHLHGPLPSLYEPYVHEGVQWAMAIDLNACTGCSACVVACQAENNVPVVGKRDVLRSREMHWLRIDRYFTGPPENPRAVTQPMLCQHCEKAPCEYVCPVNATTHSPDGLNEMTYNRCVGTRFCSNNCPYKVRRFNWFDYTSRAAPSVRMAMNPEVTVRARGVMEKCSFCVQRIRNAEITAEVQQRPLRDGDVVTACQQACPTQAIAFGSMTDPESTVSRWIADSRAYSVLEELGTRPRVRYLARITNPNPELS